MTTHHRGESAKLHPTHKEFLILRIASGRIVSLRAVRTGEEATYVGIHIRISSQGVVQAKRHLLAETVPRRTDVTTPGVGTITLLTCKVTAGEDEDTLTFIYSTLTVIHTTHRHQREGIAYTAIRTHRCGLVTLFLCQIHLVRVGRVHPPGINTHLVQT